MILHNYVFVAGSTKPDAALVDVFGSSAMLWVIWTSGCYAFVFQQPIGIGPETRLARGPDISSA